MKKILSIICTAIILFSCSTNSNNGTVTVAPLAPTNLTGLATSTSQINLSWTDNATNEDGYKIERKTSGGNFTVIGSTGGNISNFSDLGLTGNTAYTYRVYAYNSAGNSLQYSNEVTVTTQDTIPSWLSNGLVGYWPFNGNANDESGNGNNGTVNGATLTADRGNNLNQAFYFDGIDDVITIPDNIQLRLSSGDFTISVWHKTLSYGLPNRNFIIKSDGPGATNKWVVQKTAVINGGPDLSFHTNGTLGNFYASASTNEDTLWHHLIVLKEGTIIKLYQDGELTTNNTSLQMQTSSAEIRIGGDEVFGGGHWHHGLLDDIRIYNRALSASEVVYLASH